MQSPDVLALPVFVPGSDYDQDNYAGNDQNQPETPTAEQAEPVVLSEAARRLLFRDFFDFDEPIDT